MSADAASNEPARRASTSGLARCLDHLAAIPRPLRLLVPAVGMAIQWWGSSQVPGGEPQGPIGALLHNALHVIAYACLSASLWLAFSSRPIAVVHAWRSRGAWLVASLYGVVDELHQSYVPGRVCSIADLCSDAAGAALAVVVLGGIVGTKTRWLPAAAGLVVVSIASVLLATFASW